jgi:hypothetical protein
MDFLEILYAAVVAVITGLALVSHIIIHGRTPPIDVMNTSIILVLRAVGRLFDVRRGEDEHPWSRRYNAAFSDFAKPNLHSRMLMIMS